MKMPIQARASFSGEGETPVKPILGWLSSHGLGPVLLVFSLAFPPEPLAQPSKIVETDANAIVPTQVIPLFNKSGFPKLYAWLDTTKYDDPDHVFSVTNGLVSNAFATATALP